MLFAADGRCGGVEARSAVSRCLRPLLRLMLLRRQALDGPRPYGKFVVMLLLEKTARLFFVCQSERKEEVLGVLAASSFCHFPGTARQYAPPFVRMCWGYAVCSHSLRCLYGGCPSVSAQILMLMLILFSGFVFVGARLVTCVFLCHDGWCLDRKIFLFFVLWFYFARGGASLPLVPRAYIPPPNIGFSPVEWFDNPLCRSGQSELVCGQSQRGWVRMVRMQATREL